jgi:hypothetical protein
MDRAQVGLKLAFDYLGIPIYQNKPDYICDIFYLAQKQNLVLNLERALIDKETQKPSFPKLDNTDKPKSRDLLEDIRVINHDITNMFDISAGYQLEKDFTKKLDKFKKYLIEKAYLGPRPPDMQEGC